VDSVERVRLALQNKAPDRVPVALLNFMVTARLMGASSFADFFRDGEAMAEGQIKAWRIYGHDMLMLENGTATLAQACGVHVVYQKDSAPVAKEPAIKSLDEVKKLKVPDPYQDAELSQMLKATRLVVRAIGDKAFILAGADQGPFSLACEIRGMSELMLDIALGEKTAEIHRLLDFCRQVVTRYAYAQIEQGAHATSIGDSPSGPDLLSPRHYRSYAYPYVKRLADDMKSSKIILSYHICGNATPIIADMVNSGAAILEIDQKADQIASKAAAAGKATLLGAVDPSEVLAKGTPEQVEEKCRTAIENLGANGGFILAPGCALPATTPDENIAAMIAAAQKYAYSHT
jgi:uroporphyrinogen decarboxylase